MKWRSLGEQIGLPEELVGGSRFPGPGLAIAVIGEITARRLQILRTSTSPPRGNRHGRPDPETLQSFAVLLPIKSVGVMGDAPHIRKTSPPFAP